MNRVDTTLADVFQLLSLFFLTIGKSRSAPATYCQLATMMVCFAPCERLYVLITSSRNYWII